MSEKLPPVLRWRYERSDRPGMVPGDRGDVFADAAWESKELEVERDAARQVLQDIREQIDERSRYWLVEEVVLGVEPYIDADVYCRCAYEAPLEQVLDVSVTVVPGEVIEPVIPNRKRVKEHVFKQGVDDE